MAEKQGVFSDYLTIAELADELGLTDRTLRRWARLRIGPPQRRMGPRRILYKVSDVREWLDSQRVAQ